MRIMPLGVATGYIEADTEERKESKEFLRDTLKSGIANWNTFNMGQQSKQQAELAKTRDLVEQLKVAIPADAFSHLSPEQQKAARSNAIIAIAKGGENSVNGFLTNKTNFLNNAQTKAIGKNGFGYNSKLQNQKFFNTQFTFDDEVMYTDVDEWSIQDAMDKYATNKFDTNTVVQSMGGRYKVNKASVNNYVEQLKLAHTGGIPIGLMRTNKDANTAYNGVVYHAGSVMPLGEAAVAAGAMADLNYKNATLESRIGQEIDKGIITKSQKAVQIATENIQIDINKIQRSNLSQDLKTKKVNAYVAEQTKLLQVKAVIDQVAAGEFDAHGTIAQQYNKNTAMITKLTNEAEVESQKLSGLKKGSPEYIAQNNKVKEKRALLDEEYVKGSDILTALEIFNQVSAYGTNMGTVEKLTDFFTNSDYRQTVKSMAEHLGSITGQGFDVDQFGRTLWHTDSDDEKQALNQAKYAAAQMVKEFMKNQTGGYDYGRALDNVRAEMNSQAWLDQFTLDGDPVLQLRAEMVNPAFENEPQDVQDMLASMDTPLKPYVTISKTEVGLNSQNISTLKIIKQELRTKISKYYEDNNMFVILPNNKSNQLQTTTAQRKQAQLIVDQLFEQYGFDL